MKAELDIKPFLKAINEFRTEEQQPCGIQVVEWVGLVAIIYFQHSRRSRALLPNLTIHF